MTVYYPCPECGADVDDDNEWIKEYPIEYCSNYYTPYHKKCGIKSHLDFCNCGGPWGSSEKQPPLKSQKIQIDGYVYLMQSGSYYKIGYTTSVERREAQLAIQLPDKLTRVHIIKTDDPAGIEAYWHNRFRDKRKNGEWFELSLEDIQIFKKRDFM